MTNLKFFLLINIYMSHLLLSFKITISKSTKNEHNITKIIATLCK